MSAPCSESHAREEGTYLAEAGRRPDAIASVLRKRRRASNCRDVCNAVSAPDIANTCEGRLHVPVRAARGRQLFVPVGALQALLLAPSPPQLLAMQPAPARMGPPGRHQAWLPSIFDFLLPPVPGAEKAGPKQHGQRRAKDTDFRKVFASYEPSRTLTQGVRHSFRVPRHNGAPVPVSAWQTSDFLSLAPAA